MAITFDNEPVVGIAPHVLPLAAANTPFNEKATTALSAACSLLLKENIRGEILCKALFFIAVRYLFNGASPHAALKRYVHIQMRCLEMRLSPLSVRTAHTLVPRRLSRFGRSVDPSSARAKLDAAIKGAKNRRLLRQGVDMDRPKPKVRCCVCTRSRVQAP